MNPRLLAIAGPLKGRFFKLTEERIYIGRGLRNDICISDPSVLSQHCLILKESDRFKISDLENLNQTFVNDDKTPVKERFLYHGDTRTYGSNQEEGSDFS
jgi:pSer/pThr/pTyr-binding forkhead associated (FHA) protein